MVYSGTPPSCRWRLWAGRARPRRGGEPSVSMQRADPVSGGFPHLQQPPRACAGRAWQVQTIGARPAPAHNPACAHPDGLLRSLMAVEVGGPVVHQDTPALEQVRAGIGRLDPVPDHMRQGRLDDFPGRSDGRSKQAKVLSSYIYIASSSVQSPHRSPHINAVSESVFIPRCLTAILVL